MYKIVNKELGIASCNISELTMQQVESFLGQWEEGAKIGELTLFFDKEKDLLVLNNDHSNYKEYLDIAEAFLQTDDQEFYKAKEKTSGMVAEAMQVLESCRIYRKIKDDLIINEHQKTVGFRGTYLGLVFQAMLKETDNPLFMFSRAYNLGKIHGKREERARRKK